MANVRISFSKPDDLSKDPVLEISHEAVTTWSKDFIVWEIKSTDDRVK